MNRHPGSLPPRQLHRAVRTLDWLPNEGQFDESRRRLKPRPPWRRCRIRPPFETVVIQAQPLRNATDTVSAGQRRAKAHSGAGIRFPRRRDFRQSSSRRCASSISDENDRFRFHCCLHYVFVVAEPSRRPKAVTQSYRSNTISGISSFFAR